MDKSEDGGTGLVVVSGFDGGVDLDGWLGVDGTDCVGVGARVVLESGTDLKEDARATSVFDAKSTVNRLFWILSPRISTLSWPATVAVTRMLPGSTNTPETTPGGAFRVTVSAVPMAASSSVLTAGAVTIDS